MMLPNLMYSYSGFLFSVTICQKRKPWDSIYEIILVYPAKPPHAKAFKSECGEKLNKRASQSGGGSKALDVCFGVRGVPPYWIYRYIKRHMPRLIEWGEGNLSHCEDFLTLYNSWMCNGYRMLSMIVSRLRSYIT